MTKQELKRLYVATFGKIGPELVSTTEAFHGAMMSIADEPSGEFETRKLTCEGCQSVMTFQHLVGTPLRIVHVVCVCGYKTPGERPADEKDMTSLFDTQISDFVKLAMDAMVAKKESEFKAALDDFYGTWTLEEIKRRCQLVRVVGSPVETLYADGVPILEIHPMEFSEPVLEGDRYVQRVTQNYRRLSGRR